MNRLVPVIIVCGAGIIGAGILSMILLLGKNTRPSQPTPTVTEVATFAGGCFWCMQPPFEKANGVVKVLVGYEGGTGPNPTYQDYAQKGHIEVVQVTFDPTVVSYEKLLNIFWHQINPTDAGGQFGDRGPQYRSAILYHSPEQKHAAEISKEVLNASGKFRQPVTTEIIPATTFYPAEEYHQAYHTKNPLKYKFFRYRSGRDAFIAQAWADSVQTHQAAAYQKPTEQELRTRLTPIQYEVTQRNGTEPAFKNAYWNNEQPGIYVDIVSGEPLFSSLDKFDSGTGWPSFTKPITPGAVVEKIDRGWLHTRTEVRSKMADSHVGHVFNDGPPPTKLRYCMNSAALRFVPVADFDKEGLSSYTHFFA